MTSRSQDKLNNALAQFNSLEIDKQINFQKLYLYSIITHSTAIEGSTITEIENTLMFDEDIVPSGHNVTEQLMNIDLKHAYDFVIKNLSKKPEITVEYLKMLSAMIMKNTGSSYNTATGNFDSSAGDLRLVNVSAGRGGKSYLGYHKIPQNIEKFCIWLNSEREKTFSNAADVYELSFEAHYRLVSIHPWVDGNGRVCRLLMNMIQMENGLLPSILLKENKAQYIEALARSQDADDSTYFIRFMLTSTTNFILKCVDDFKGTRGIFLCQSI